MTNLLCFLIILYTNSTQEVSKWEEECGYPETEKLILIAQKLDVSLDSLVMDKQLIDESNSDFKGNIISFPMDRKITIQSWDGKVRSAFYKLEIRKVLNAREDEPKHILCGTDRSSFLGSSLAELGWYLTLEDARRELSEIYESMQNGEATYQLKYYVKPKEKSFGINIISGW